MSQNPTDNIPENTKAFQNISLHFRHAAKPPLTEAQAHQAVRNLAGFCAILIDIHRRLNKEANHEQQD